MEEALTQITEELARSRADYSALFQNFKQSRILFEERDLVSKAQVQRTQKENKELDGALQQLNCELNVHRLEYSALLQNFEESCTLSEQRERVSRGSVEQINEQCEALKHKILEQKNIMKAQRATQRDFSNDLHKFEQATKLSVMREIAVVEKLDSANIMISNLKDELNLKNKLLMKQSIDIDALNSIIANDMVTKADFDRIGAEKKKLQRLLDSETVSLEAHHNVKEMYADLRHKVESSMVTVDEYEVIVSKCKMLQEKLENEYVTRVDYLQLQEKYHRIVDEKCELNGSIEFLNSAKATATRALSASKDIIDILQVQLKDVEKDLSAFRAAEDLRIEVAVIEEERQLLLDRDRATQRNLQTIGSIRKEIYTTDLMTDTFKSMENEIVNLNLKAQDESLELREKHAIELMKVIEDHNIMMAAEIAKNEKNRQEMKVQYSMEVAAICERETKHINSLLAERDALRIASEAAHETELAAIHSAYQISKDSDALKHETDMEEMRRIVITDHNHTVSKDFLELKDAFNKESAVFKTQLMRAEDALKFEGDRAESSISDLFQIRNEYKVALSAVENAYNEEMMKRMQSNSENQLWQQQAERVQSQIISQQGTLQFLLLEKERMLAENSMLKSSATNYENDSKELRGQLDGLKDAVLESFSASLNRSGSSIHLTSSAPTSNNINTSKILSDYDENFQHSDDVNSPFISNLQKRTLSTNSKISPRSSRIASNKAMMHASCANNSGKDNRVKIMTPIQAAINRKNILAANIASLSFPNQQQVEHQRLKEHKVSNLSKKSVEIKKKNTDYKYNPRLTVSTESQSNQYPLIYDIHHSDDGKCVMDGRRSTPVESMKEMINRQTLSNGTQTGIGNFSNSSIPLGWTDVDVTAPAMAMPSTVRSIAPLYSPITPTSVIVSAMPFSPIPIVPSTVSSIHSILPIPTTVTPASIRPVIIQTKTTSSSMMSGLTAQQINLMQGIPSSVYNSLPPPPDPGSPPALTQAPSSSLELMDRLNSLVKDWSPKEIR